MHSLGYPIILLYFLVSVCALTSLPLCTNVEVKHRVVYNAMDTGRVAVISMLDSRQYRYHYKAKFALKHIKNKIQSGRSYKVLSLLVDKIWLHPVTTWRFYKGVIIRFSGRDQNLTVPSCYVYFFFLRKWTIRKWKGGK